MLLFVDVKRHVQQNPCPSEEIFAGMQLQTEAVLLRQTSGIYIYIHFSPYPQLVVF